MAHPISELVNSTVASLPDPYFGEPNFKLVFQVPSGTYTVDGFGIEKPVMTEAIVLCSVREEEFRSKEEELPGAGLFDMFLLGHCINPKVLPTGIDLQNLAYAELTDTANNTKQVGDFRMLPSVQHRFAGVTKWRGQRIQGVFTLRGAL